MRTRLVVGILIIALAVAACLVLNAAPRNRGAAAGPPAVVGAQKPGWCGCPLGCLMPGKLVKELGLTDTQIAELKRLHLQFLDETKTAREEIQAKAKEMFNLWLADSPDADAIKSLAAEIDTLRDQIRNAGIDHMISALNVLTPAQRDKLRAILKDCAARCFGKAGRGFWCCPCFGCGPCIGPCICCGWGMGPGAGMGCGVGPGWGNGTGPRCGTQACPLIR
ncbi:MAG: Spy/CpxP family protein refolding chaperone [Armatimonadetes bacterium]|nr:Spy/CpxP family protein refolding chaperone [Armatimonadota bacterium]